MQVKLRCLTFLKSRLLAYRLFRQKRTDFGGLYLCLYLSQRANKYGVRKPISRAFQNGMLEQNQTILRGSKQTFKKRPVFLYFFFQIWAGLQYKFRNVGSKMSGFHPKQAGIPFGESKLHFLKLSGLVNMVTNFFCC